MEGSSDRRMQGFDRKKRREARGINHGLLFSDSSGPRAGAICSQSLWGFIPLKIPCRASRVIFRGFSSSFTRQGAPQRTHTVIQYVMISKLVPVLLGHIQGKAKKSEDRPALVLG